MNTSVQCEPETVKTVRACAYRSIVHTSNSVHTVEVRVHTIGRELLISLFEYNNCNIITKMSLSLELQFRVHVNMIVSTQVGNTNKSTYLLLILVCWRIGKQCRNMEHDLVSMNRRIQRMHSSGVSCNPGNPCIALMISAIKIQCQQVVD
jgi:hypothetical protein